MNVRYMFIKGLCMIVIDSHSVHRASLVNKLCAPSWSVVLLGPKRV